ncbi:Coenzyme F420 hydrogenase/dehydrogenase, beta subunit C-terminal domain [Litoreibacter arenae]|uniref:Coenzyme F420-reducing hydrogenase n=1 Tax=Litoreibacter arenae DSM 19593 TaxID=1123360 RepID=S9Q827_9RHOB|nr:Coenzyme F420 hydrogenase/dehydrogenase, beta subunit C-terminal domain [Litoreibacter arenae]EPX77516.1 coenzyme F420-reducing hydrogenase [Litoreibacter arenae DSM 19593]
MPDPIPNVLKGDLCAGCGGCAAVAPDGAQMVMSPQGYLRPRLSRTLNSHERDTLGRICPGVGQVCAPDGRKNDPIWGPYLTAQTGYTADKKLRHGAASGGALSGFLTALIETGEVDAVIHVTADPANPLANVTMISTTPSQIAQAAGSRYAPSSPLDVFGGLRGDRRRFAFVGKPCDVSALHAWRKLDPEIAHMVPVLISFFCAGVPSLHGGRQIIDRLEVKASDLTRFQHRAGGWPGCATATLKDHSQRSMSYAESWGDILSKTVQHRCKICADGSGVFADVVFADAWQADAKGYPSFDDRPGQSLVLCRTAKGQAMVDTAQSSGHLSLAPYSLDTLAAVQPGQTRRRRVLLARLAALKLAGRPIPRYRGMGLFSVARRASPLEMLRNFAGMLRRCLRRKPQGERTC